MKTLMLILAGLMVAGAAEAKGRKARPVVCEDYSIVEDRGASEELVVICYDKHDQRPLTTWTEVKVSSPEGSKTVVVGYR
jgi:hypothetical protein